MCPPRPDRPAALMKFKSNPVKFGIIITDVTMPKLAGIDLAKAMREIHPDIPIIMCTGYSESFDMNWANLFGIQEFIWKPVSLDKLTNRVRQVLKREGTVVVSVLGANRLDSPAGIDYYYGSLNPG